MLGIIGGTILLDVQAIERPDARVVDTRFGAAEVDVGVMAGVPVALVQRHGRKRDKPPHRINHPANLAALQSLGVTRVVGLGSTGCLRADIPLPSLMVPDDYVSFADPTIHDDRLVHVTPGFDDGVRAVLVEEANRESDVRIYPTGVYVQCRGPRLDTRAEVRFMQTLGDCVGMTIASEATIARELGLAYAALCTLDNYANGIRGEVVEQARINQAARQNAHACLGILARALVRLA